MPSMEKGFKTTNQKFIMEKIKINFDTGAEERLKTYTVEVPYKDGIVITSEFCPAELISEKVNLLAAFRGEPLEKFMEDCRRQVFAMSQIQDTDSPLDKHIGGLMAVVMDHLSRDKSIDFGNLLMLVDCFSLLLKGAGFKDKEIREIYPRVTKTIQELYK